MATMPTVRDAMETYALLWRALCASLGDAGMSQTTVLKEYIPFDEVDFDEFEELGFNTVFTSSKIATKLMGSYNGLMLLRDSLNRNVAIPVLEFNDCVVMIPLGEPGRDVGGSIAHLMCVKASLEGPITFNEMLPTTPAETAYFEMCLDLFEKAYKNLNENVPVSECGAIVMAKATELGLEHTVGIREFVVAAIAAVDKGEGVLPGFVLKDQNGDDIAGDSDAVKDKINEVFGGQLIKFRAFIQPPTDVSMLSSHLHAFEDQEFPQEMLDTYVDCREILEEKKRLLTMSGSEPEPEGDDGSALRRTKSKRG